MRRIWLALAVLLGLLTTQSVAAAPSPGTWQVLALQRPAPVFYRPSGIAVGAGSIWVSDSAYGTVTRLSPSGAVQSGWGTPHQFGEPSGVAVSNTRRVVYVAESDSQRVRVFSLSGAQLARTAPIASPSASSLADVVVATGPSGNAVAVRGGNPALSIVRIGPDGRILSRWTSRLHHQVDLSYTGPLGPDPLQFGGLHPLGVVVGRTGEIDIYFQALASGGGRDEVSRSWTFVQRISYRGAFLRETPIAYDSPGDAAPPTGLALTGQGDLFLPDTGSFRIMRLPPGGSGRWLSAPTSCGTFTPAGLALDADRLLLASWQDATIHVLSFSGHEQGRWGACPSSLFRNPFGVAVDGEGDVYVTDTLNEEVVKLGPDGGVLRRWSVSGSPAAAPVSVALRPDGDLYVVEAAAAMIDTYSPNGDLIARWGGKGVAPGKFDGPLSVAVARNGDVYVADSNNNRVQRLSPMGAVLGAWGGPTERGSGAGQFSTPVAVALGPDGSVYIADSGNARIVVRAPDGHVLRTVSVPLSVPGGMRFPESVVVGSDGSIYVVDPTDHLLKLSPTGALLGEWGGTGVARGEFQGLTGIALDGRGSIYAVDRRNHRVQKLTF